MGNLVVKKFFHTLETFEFLQYSRIKVFLLYHPLYHLKIFLRKTNVDEIDALRFIIKSNRLLFFSFLRNYNSLKTIDR